MPIIFHLSQTKTIENLAVLCCALLGEDVTVDAQKPDPRGRMVEAIFETESATVRATIDCSGAIQNLTISVDGKPSNPAVDLSALFNTVQRCAKLKKPTKTYSR